MSICDMPAQKDQFSYAIYLYAIKITRLNLRDHKIYYFRSLKLCKFVYL